MPRELNDQIPDSIWDVELEDEELGQDSEEEDQEDPSLEEEDDSSEQDQEDEDEESDDDSDTDQEDEWWEEKEETEEEEKEEEEDPTPEWYVSEEEYRKLQSASTKWTQKLIHRNKALNRAFEVLWDVADDQEKLIELYENEKQVAEVILEKYYWWVSIQEFAKDVLWKEYTPDWAEDEPQSEEQIRKKVMEEIQEKEVQDYVWKLFAKAKLTKWEAQKVLDEFNDLSEWKKLTKEKAKKYFQISYDIVRKSPRKDDPKTKIAKKTASWSWGKGWGSSNAPKDPYVQDAVDFLKEMAIS